jgi:hypothetical protein
MKLLNLDPFGGEKNRRNIHFKFNSTSRRLVKILNNFVYSDKDKEEEEEEEEGALF